jgi:hypothetical protein
MRWNMEGMLGSSYSIFSFLWSILWVVICLFCPLCHLYCPSFFDYQLFDIFELFLGHSCFRRFMFGIMILFIHAYFQSFNLLNKHLSNINYRIFISYKSFNKSGQRYAWMNKIMISNIKRLKQLWPRKSSKISKSW